MGSRRRRRHNPRLFCGRLLVGFARAMIRSLDRRRRGVAGRRMDPLRMDTTLLIKDAEVDVEMKQ